MSWRRHSAGFIFTFIFIFSYFTNKFVLSVLKFTYPTLFQGWQTLIGAVLLLLCARLGWVELSRVTRSAALAWLPGSLLFVGNIYAGSRALSQLALPVFFTLQSSAHVVTFVLLKVIRRETGQWLKLLSLSFFLLSAVNLPHFDPQYDSAGYLWALGHLVCVGAYRVFQLHLKPNTLSDLEQQCINYLFSVLLLGVAAHPTGDLSAALDFPSLRSLTFTCGCCASALLGFLLLLATHRLKGGLPLQHCGLWLCLSKVSAISLSPLIFSLDLNTPSALCVLLSLLGEALLVYSDPE